MLEELHQPILIKKVPVYRKIKTVLIDYQYGNVLYIVGYGRGSISFFGGSSPEELHQPILIKKNTRYSCSRRYEDSFD